MHLFSLRETPQAAVLGRWRCSQRIDAPLWKCINLDEHRRQGLLLLSVHGKLNLFWFRLVFVLKVLVSFEVGKEWGGRVNEHGGERNTNFVGKLKCLADMS